MKSKLHGGFCWQRLYFNPPLSLVSTYQCFKGKYNWLVDTKKTHTTIESMKRIKSHCVSPRKFNVHTSGSRNTLYYIIHYYVMQSLNCMDMTSALNRLTLWKKKTVDLYNSMKGSRWRSARHSTSGHLKVIWRKI